MTLLLEESARRYGHIVILLNRYSRVRTKPTDGRLISSSFSYACRTKKIYHPLMPKVSGVRTLSKAFKRHCQYIHHVDAERLYYPMRVKCMVSDALFEISIICQRVRERAVECEKEMDRDLSTLPCLTMNLITNCLQSSTLLLVYIYLPVSFSLPLSLFHCASLFGFVAFRAFLCVCTSVGWVKTENKQEFCGCRSLFPLFEF